MCDNRNINGGCKESVGSRKISVVNKAQNQYPVSYKYLYILSILIFLHNIGPENYLLYMGLQVACSKPRHATGISQHEIMH